mgnify:CR=1 FL=1
MFLVPETEGILICDLAKCIDAGIGTRPGVIRHLQRVQLYSGLIAKFEDVRKFTIEASEIELDIASMC